MLNIIDKIGYFYESIYSDDQKWIFHLENNIWKIYKNDQFQTTLKTFEINSFLEKNKISKDNFNNVLKSVIICQAMYYEQLEKDNFIYKLILKQIDRNLIIDNLNAFEQALSEIVNNLKKPSLKLIK